MANFCPNCGNPVGADDLFCAACGAALDGGDAPVAATADSGVSASDVLGTLVTVSLIGGLTRRLYYRGGRYFLDPYCRNPFMDAHRIIGRPRPMRGPACRPMGGPRGPVGGGPRGPVGGGPRGGGPMGGGPRGGGPVGGGPRGGGRGGKR